ncbi:hypothetical protein HAX54_034846 [Datura stramonium]|uniref:UDP-3-O-acyl-N-acetylglucosamine deacetylase n=1 Tax=Datura stramonium TaxID=4076 RepID=A0ABS8VG77_DATST|nr:hypothetical protein [Datura stramonium]
MPRALNDALWSWSGRTTDKQVPILDGSAREWVDAIEEAGLRAALDRSGKSCEKLAPVLKEPVTVWENESFIAAFPYSKVKITYGIDFPQAPEIGCQWFSSTCLDKDFFAKELASARTFCIYEQVEQLRKSGVIKGGSAKNAIVCSESRGWLNPPLRFNDEPCRHKVLDLIGDLSLLAHSGNQGLPVAHIIVYKAKGEVPSRVELRSARPSGSPHLADFLCNIHSPTQETSSIWQDMSLPYTLLCEGCLVFRTWLNFGLVSCSKLAQRAPEHCWASPWLCYAPLVIFLGILPAIQHSTSTIMQE